MDETRARPAAAPRDTPSRQRVLIIDDEESLRLLFARVLAGELGVEVELAGTAEQALRRAKTCAYDAILLDLLLPGMGGIQLLDEIRKASANVATPVSVVSVLADAETKNRCLAGGANAYLAKPVAPALLAATVREQIAARGRKPDRRT
ncbi:MAG: response regulator [Burkholderiales bacterium]|nr:response regulator [Burkholderiales bacterium]